MQPLDNAKHSIRKRWTEVGLLLVAIGSLLFSGNDVIGFSRRGGSDLVYDFHHTHYFLPPSPPKIDAARLVLLVDKFLADLELSVSKGQLSISEHALDISLERLATTPSFPFTINPLDLQVLMEGQSLPRAIPGSPLQERYSPKIADALQRLLSAFLPEAPLGRERAYSRLRIQNNGGTVTKNESISIRKYSAVGARVEQPDYTDSADAVVNKEHEVISIRRVKDIEPGSHVDLLSWPDFIISPLDPDLKVTYGDGSLVRRMDLIDEAPIPIREHRRRLLGRSPGELISSSWLSIGAMDLGTALPSHGSPEGGNSAL